MSSKRHGDRILWNWEGETRAKAKRRDWRKVKKERMEKMEMMERMERMERMQ